MSSKKAMKQAQKQAYAKHRSNITDSRFNPADNRFNLRNKDLPKVKKKMLDLILIYIQMVKSVYLY